MNRADEGTQTKKASPNGRAKRRPTEPVSAQQPLRPYDFSAAARNRFNVNG